MSRVLLAIILFLSWPWAAFATVTVQITEPTSASTYTTTGSTITLQGTITTTTGTIERLVWDNIDTDDAGVTIEVSQPSGYPFTTVPAISLKPGTNEILLTATASDGLVGTDKITVTRTVSSPTISGVSANVSSLRMYEKYELTFSLDTCASVKNYLWSYDASAPSGVTSGLGVSAYASIVTPTQGTKTQPAFYYRGADLSGDWWNGHYTPNTTANWKVRYSPQEEGTHTVTLYATDSCGTTSYAVGTFTATLPNTEGFVAVSTDDPQYFKRSTGKIWWPLGPAVRKVATGYSTYADTAVNLNRPWMAGHSGFSTNWSKWLRTDNSETGEAGFPDLSYAEHYPTSELSREISTGSDCGLWTGVWTDEQISGLDNVPTFHARLTSGVQYLVKLRLKTASMGSQSNGSYPYGLMLKTHGWVNREGACTGDYVNVLRDGAYTNMLGTAVSTTRDWHTVVVTYTANSNDASREYFSLYLDNISAGSVYIDQISIKPETSPGSGVYSPELVRQGRADLHTYVENHVAYFWDQEVAAAESAGVFLKYVVQDKKDWIPNHISYPSGAWVDGTEYGTWTQTGAGYYQGAVGYYNSGGYNGTKGKWQWLQEQWWRYLIARYGYSTAIFSWEFCNEAPPGDADVRRASDNFARYMQLNNPHPQLVSTSTWSTYPSDGDLADFIGDTSYYPYIDFGDVHAYRYNSDAGSDDDFGVFMKNIMVTVMSAANFARPVIISETGVQDADYGADDILTAASTSVKNVMYHNGTWVALHPRAGFLGQYWYTAEHLPDAMAHEDLTTGFRAFIKDSDLHKGGYVDASASASSGCIVYGSKNTTKKKAYLWLRNSNYYWNYVRVSGTPSAVSGDITVPMNPNTKYIIERWSTTTGTISEYLTRTSSATSPYNLTIPYTSLTTDYAYKIYPADWRTVGYNAKRVGRTPENVGGSATSWTWAWAATFTNENIAQDASIVTGGAYAYIGTLGRSGTYGGKIYGLNPATGATVWTYSDLKGGIQHTLTYDDYAGGTVFGASTKGEIVALNASSGAERWKVDTVYGGFYVCPAVADDTVLVGSKNGYFYAYTTAGTLKWSKNIGVPIIQTAAADNGVVYFMSEDCIAHALYISSGEYVSGWPASQQYCASARRWWPVVASDTYVIFPATNSWYQVDGWLTIESNLGSGSRTEANIEKDCAGITEPPASFTTWLNTDAGRYYQGMYIFNRSTAAKTTTQVTRMGDGGEGGPPPVVDGSGNVIVEYRTRCSWWDRYEWALAFTAMGYLSLSDGTTTQIVPDNINGYDGVLWGHFYIIGDETCMQTMAENTLFNVAQDQWSGWDADTNDTFAGLGERDAYGGTLVNGGGYSAVAWSGAKWHGSGRNSLTISNGRVYHVTGGRIIAATGD